MCFRPQMRKWEARTLLCPLEIANLYHWTSGMLFFRIKDDEQSPKGSNSYQKLSNPNCNTPSSG
jgi:hypothetical protein